MAKAKPTTELGPDWVRKATAVAASGVGERQFDSRHRKLLPPEMVRQVGREVFVHIPSLVALVVRLAMEEAKSSPTDPMLAGDDSPALERYRAARADQEEMKRDQMRLSLVAVSDIKPALLALAANVRRAGEKLERTHGHDAAQVLNEALAEFEAGIPNVIPDDPGGEGTAPERHGGDENAAPADDAGVGRAGDRDS